jgi:hypothetical protein
VELQWIAIGVLTAGVTVTNIVVIVVLYFARQVSLVDGFWRRAGRTAAVGAIALAVTFTAGYALDELFDAQPGNTPSEMVWISRYFVDDPGVQLATFPTAVVNGIAPPVPGRKPNRFALKAKATGAVKPPPPASRRHPKPSGLTAPGRMAAPERETAPAGTAGTAGHGGPVTPRLLEGTPVTARDGSGSPDPSQRQAEASASSVDAQQNAGEPDRIIRYCLTLQRTHAPRSLRNYIGYALLGALAWVAFRERSLGPALRALAIASLAVIGFNWLFHGFWGGEQFLYTQHWHVSLLVLLAAAVSVFEARRWSALALLVMCVFGVAVSNAIVLSKALAVLAGD